jgi:hypothetical protein
LKVSGHFNGTSTKFNIYLPPRDRWQGRFLQQVYPTQDENASDQDIAFSVDSGAYVVQVTGTAGFRADAAAAKFAKTFAAEYYKEPSRRIYGYIYGGSGGSYQTVGAMENTRGVWDGAVVVVQAIPVSIPNVPAMRTFAGLVLRNKTAQIIDAVRPGGSGDPYSALSPVEKAILHEATTMGLPLRKWEDYEKVADPFTITVLTPTVQQLDPTYANDFWGKSGYLGTEDSALGDFVRSRRIAMNTTIKSITRNDTGAPTVIVPDELPEMDTAGVTLNLYSSNATLVGHVNGVVNLTLGEITIDSGNDETILNAVQPGATIEMDNRWFLAMLSYYRHQIPRRPGFYEWDQFLNSEGQPIYPQREVDTPAIVASSVSGGGTHTGNITGKVIVVDNLWDSDAWAPHADWYRSKVQTALGSRFQGNYRLYYNDHADHNFGPPGLVRSAYLVEYTGIYQQALRDVSHWVEKGKTPPESTQYTILDSQIMVPDTATERLGIQPTVNLTVQGDVVAYSQSGKTVELTAIAQVPPEAGQIVSLEWDVFGRGKFTAILNFSPRESAVVNTTVEYLAPGTYFPGIRVTSQREGNAETPFARVSNLGRARVVVT